MGNVIHETRPVQVWADIDKGIAGAVEYLNSLEGVRTFASCQGTIGEGGAEPYRAHILAYWPEFHNAKIKARFEIGEGDEGSRMLYMRADVDACENCEAPCPDDEMKETEDMVELCPACWSACCMIS